MPLSLKSLILGAAFVAANPQLPALPKGVGMGKGGNGLLDMLGKMTGLPQLKPGDDMISSVCKTKGTVIETIFGSPWGTGPGEECLRDDSGGSGPYKANYTEDPTLPDRTIYVPKNPPPNSEKLPVIIWGNGKRTNQMNSWTLGKLKWRRGMPSSWTYVLQLFERSCQSRLYDCC
jgi:hypothetical protein